jgi:hypothetical protein
MLAALVGAGLLHGVWSGRWEGVERLEQVARKVKHLPVAIGDWDSSAAGADSLAVLPPGETNISRYYVNRKSGDAVSLLVGWGLPEPILFNHTPLGCYPGKGYVLLGSPRRHWVAKDGDAVGQFWVATFSRTKQAVPEHVRVAWAWAATGDWQAPESPRRAFAGRRLLYKVYIIHRLVREDEPLEEDPALEFIRAIIPELNQTLFQTHQANPKLVSH